MFCQATIYYSVEFGEINVYATIIYDKELAGFLPYKFSFLHVKKRGKEYNRKVKVIPHLEIGFALAWLFLKLVTCVDEFASKHGKFR